MESQHGSMTAAASSMENGQVHHSDDSSSVDQLRAQLQEQVLPVFFHILSLLLTCGLYTVALMILILHLFLSYASSRIKTNLSCPH